MQDPPENESPDVVMAIGAFVDGLYNLNLQSIVDAGHYAYKAATEEKLPRQFFDKEQIREVKEVPKPPKTVPRFRGLPPSDIQIPSPFSDIRSCESEMSSGDVLLPSSESDSSQSVNTDGHSTNTDGHSINTDAHSDYQSDAQSDYQSDAQSSTKDTPGLSWDSSKDSEFWSEVESHESASLGSSLGSGPQQEDLQVVRSDEVQDIPSPANSNDDAKATVRNKGRSIVSTLSAKRYKAKNGDESTAKVNRDTTDKAFNETKNTKDSVNVASKKQNSKPIQNAKEEAIVGQGEKDATFSKPKSKSEKLESKDKKDNVHKKEREGEQEKATEKTSVETKKDDETDETNGRGRGRGRGRDQIDIEEMLSRDRGKIIGRRRCRSLNHSKMRGETEAKDKVEQPPEPKPKAKPSVTFKDPRPDPTGSMLRPPPSPRAAQNKKGKAAKSNDSQSDKKTSRKASPIHSHAKEQKSKRSHSHSEKQEKKKAVSMHSRRSIDFDDDVDTSAELENKKSLPFSRQRSLTALDPEKKIGSRFSRQRSLNDSYLKNRSSRKASSMHSRRSIDIDDLDSTEGAEAKSITAGIELHRSKGSKRGGCLRNTKLMKVEPEGIQTKKSDADDQKAKTKDANEKASRAVSDDREEAKANSLGKPPLKPALKPALKSALKPALKSTSKPVLKSALKNRVPEKQPPFDKEVSAAPLESDSDAGVDEPTDEDSDVEDETEEDLQKDEESEVEKRDPAPPSPVSKSQTHVSSPKKGTTADPTKQHTEKKRGFWKTLKGKKKQKE